MERKNTWLIVLLVMIILGLGGYVVYDKVLNKDDSDVVDKDDNDSGNNKEYAVYKIGEEVTLNGSKWLVISDSDENTDYVTLLASFEYDYNSTVGIDMESCTDFLSAADYDNGTTTLRYDKTCSKKIIEKNIESLPIRLKEVNGYTVRLITIDEILKLDDNWEKTETGYVYNGEKINTYLSKMTMTMSEADCEAISSAGGKCSGLYRLVEGSSSPEAAFSKTSIIASSSGLGGLKPVINVYKSDL